MFRPDTFKDFSLRVRQILVGLLP